MSNTDSQAIPSKRLQISDEDILEKKKAECEKQTPGSSEETEHILKVNLGGEDGNAEEDREFNLLEYLKGDEDESENSLDSDESDFGGDSEENRDEPST